MTKETHSKGGYIIGLLLLPYIYKTFLLDYNLTYRIVLLFIYAYFTHFGALISDIDMKGSYISKRFPIIHKLFGKRFRHRGFTHSLLFVGIIAFIGNTITISSNDNILFIKYIKAIKIGRYLTIMLSTFISCL